MPSYVITGVARGLGWEFLTQTSSDANNIVIGIVRNKAATEKRVAEELSGRSNITILEADVTKYDAVKKAAADTATITGGRLDYLIANAAYLSEADNYTSIGVLGKEPEQLTEEFNKLMGTNVLANIHLYNLFMPQILNGKVKKVVLISSGMGDIEMMRNYDIDNSPLYATSKAAMNMITAKFSAQYKKDGVLFLSICPGMVEVGHYNDMTPEQAQSVGQMVEKFKAYAPDFKGPDFPPEAIKAVLSVVEKSSVENGDGGAYLSHFGTKRWI
ncbi:NAD(P)-binding protein [Cucurbitaria berberidis CBS 394.84]|uniref:NAD(P)-binding protein n=1 Tax=Cucurbitaria berberidis CBS 394.84 TaxID=1168544 RepID=A0A9P4L9W8_9PLEO|nr:NAD(P)-binding protein [Cucurbitaria berberidis CBS 394.84]KAF1846634.1 NAD(P)-binding protein [Cucurbitaria berberidis CBS 394.84]